MKSLGRVNGVLDFFRIHHLCEYQLYFIAVKIRAFKSLFEVYRQGSKTSKDADFKYNNKLIELKFIKNL